jgi:MerR family transcriptional regulator, copper efflux regulator
MRSSAMRIGEIARLGGVNVQTLRYYEKRGLVAPSERARSGFREYDDAALRQLRFIRRAQSLGFTLDEIGDLLALWSDSETSCAAVERRASGTLDRIESKIADLRRISSALAKYVAACHERSSLEQCPLLEELGSATNVPI